MIFTVTLAYQGKEYSYQDKFEAWDEWRDAKYVAEYMYTEGNYGCDCNRSNFLAQHCDVSFEGIEGAILEHGYENGPEWVLPCGRTIELVSIEPHDIYLKKTIYTQQINGLYLPVEV